jgi:SAM-dependent methyltransferase
MAMVSRELTRSERDDAYYRIVAGLVTTRLLESCAELGLFRLFAERGPLTGDQITAILALHPKRTRKWLLTLRHAGLVEETPAQNGQEPCYRAGPLARALFFHDGTPAFFYSDFLRFTRKVFDFDFAKMLRGMPVPQVHYPPADMTEAQVLETWMGETAKETIAIIEQAITFEDARRFLDVAGGNGGMAIHYAKRYPHLSLTIFNLPNSAFIARQNIAKAGMGERISVVEGDFRKDPLPHGYDVVQFSRVMADWDENTCRMLMEKSHQALVPGGRLVICEPMTDDNRDLAVAWEFGYIPYDDFGVELYKPFSTYERLLNETGFTVIKSVRKTPDSVHSTIVAQRQ